MRCKLGCDHNVVCHSSFQAFLWWYKHTSFDRIFSLPQLLDLSFGVGPCQPLKHFIYVGFTVDSKSDTLNTYLCSCISHDWRPNVGRWKQRTWRSRQLCGEHWVGVNSCFRYSNSQIYLLSVNAGAMCYPVFNREDTEVYRNTTLLENDALKSK